MKRSLLLVLAVLSTPLIAAAEAPQGPAAETPKILTIQGDALSVRVGEATHVPVDGAVRVRIEDADVAEVAKVEGGNYLAVKGLKQGHTRLTLLRTGSNTELVYTFFVR